jgi:hypothetical protein
MEQSVDRTTRYVHRYFFPLLHPPFSHHVPLSSPFSTPTFAIFLPSLPSSSSETVLSPMSGSFKVSSVRASSSSAFFTFPSRSTSAHCSPCSPSHQTFHKDVLSDEDSAAGFTRFYRWHIDAALCVFAFPPLSFVVLD